MGTILASEIIDRIRYIVNDDDNIRWTDAEFLAWLNEGQRAIVMLKPDAYSSLEVMSLVGGTKQSLPTGGILLLDVTRNMAADGTTAEAAVTEFARSVLDAAYPGWHTATSSTTVKVFCYDSKNPLVFWVYPPQPSGTTKKLEVLISKLPTDLGAQSVAIRLDDIYATTLMDYMIYRGYSKDSDQSPGDQKAAEYYQKFMAGISGKTSAEDAFAIGLGSQADADQAQSESGGAGQ